MPASTLEDAGNTPLVGVNQGGDTHPRRFTFLFAHLPRTALVIKCTLRYRRIAFRPWCLIGKKLHIGN